jgi:hypothetical protein
MLKKFLRLYTKEEFLISLAKNLSWKTLGYAFVMKVIKSR